MFNILVFAFLIISWTSFAIRRMLRKADNYHPERVTLSIFYKKLDLELPFEHSTKPHMLLLTLLTIVLVCITFPAKLLLAFTAIVLYHIVYIHVVIDKSSKHFTEAEVKDKPVEYQLQWVRDNYTRPYAIHDRILDLIVLAIYLGYGYSLL